MADVAEAEKREDEGKIDAPSDDDNIRDCSTRRIQAMWRRVRAKSVLVAISRSVWEIAHDAESGDYFYYNRRTETSTWEKPLILGSKPPYRTDHEASRAATRIQSMFRCALARRRAATQASLVYRKEYDPVSGEFYYSNTVTGEARWNDPVGRIGGSAPLGGDSKLILDRDTQISELKRQLEAKDAEIERVRSARFEELGREVRLRRMVATLKGAKRSRNFDQWRCEQVAAWFVDMNLSEHVPALLNAKIDGLLLLNMDDDDLRELGVTKRVHLRKIELALRRYRKRYEQQRAENDSDDERAVGIKDEDDSEDEDGSHEDDDGTQDKAASAEKVEAPNRRIANADDLLPTEEELLEFERDRANVKIEVVFPGDDKNFAEIGDVVRCHCICKLAETGLEIENTRKKKQPLEFVLGAGQVVLGVDRGIIQMSFGERAMLTVSSTYAYGNQGCEPLVPPNASLIFDIELLRWKSRKPWIKPLIQPPDLTEWPYEEQDDNNGDGTHGMRPEPIDEELPTVLPVSTSEWADDDGSISTLS